MIIQILVWDCLFCEICDGVYDYKLDDGYYNLGSWVEKAEKLHNQ